MRIRPLLLHYRILRHLLCASVLLLAAWNIQCSEPLTQVVVVVDTTFSVPDQLDAVDVVVQGPSGVMTHAHGTIAMVQSLPFTLGLSPAGSVLGPVVVTVNGQLQGATIVQQVAQFDFVAGESRMLYVLLEPDCVSVACDSSQTCAAGTCRNVVVGPSDLPPWSGQPPPHMMGDAGTDDVAPDATTDATGTDVTMTEAAVQDVLRMDSTTDGATMDTAVRMDATRVDAPQDTVTGQDAGQDMMTAADCSVSAVTDFCNEIPPLAADPTIDGQLECGLTLTSISPQGWTGHVAIPQGYSVQYAAAWRPTGLYVYAEVTTSQYTAELTNQTISCGDAVEFFADTDGVYTAPPAYDAPGTIQLFTACPSSTTSQTSFATVIYHNGSGIYGPWPSSREIAVPTPTGYAVEGFITATEFGITSWQLAPNQHVGLDINLDIHGTPSDGAQCPARLGTFSLHMATQTTNCNGSPFAT